MKPTCVRRRLSVLARQIGPVGHDPGSCDVLAGVGTAAASSAPRCRVAVWGNFGGEHRVAELLRPDCDELGVELHVLSSVCGLVFPQFNPDLVAEAAAKLSEAQRQAARDEVRRVCASCDVWLGWPQGSWEAVEQLLGGWPEQLRWVQTLSAGADELMAKAPPQVLVTRAEGKFDAAIAEWVLTWVFMHAKKAPLFLEDQRRRTWRRRFQGLSRVAGSSVLLVGYGSIGLQIARLCAAVGMTVAATRRSAEAVAKDGVVSVHPASDLLGLLPAADFVVLCLPLTAQTHGSFGRRELAAMKPSAALINIARGEIVNWADIRSALEAGSLAAYYTDVTTPEPLPDGHPDWGVPNLVVTPHNSWAPYPDHSNDAQRFAGNLRRYLAGEPLRGLVETSGQWSPARARPPAQWPPPHRAPAPWTVCKVNIPELTPEFHGFSAPQMGEKVAAATEVMRGSAGGSVGFLAGVGALGNEDMTLGEMVDLIRATYTGTIGVEYMHIIDRKRCNWIRQHVESPTLLTTDKASALQTYERLCYSDGFERFMGDKFKNTKRFGVDGGEAVIPGLIAMVERGAALGAEEFVFGMPHRGRLNVLVNVHGMPMSRMLAEFMGTAYDVDAKIQELNEEDWTSAGDVRYHLGTSNVRTFPDAGNVTLTLEANSSHLETVAPVALGRTRAKQYYLGDTEDTRSRVVPVVMHGDASFAGQGVVYETMQLAHVQDFDVGGTIHVIVNNQVSNTTDPRDSRSTQYCSDLGKAFGAPIFHCNADDPIAVVKAFIMAAEYRQEWGDDVILDVVCYRRFGHNEADNPDLTQPLLYKQIRKQPRSVDLLKERLIKDGFATASELEQVNKKVWDEFEADFVAAQTYKPPEETEWLATKWEGVRTPNKVESTGVDVDLLKKIGVRLCEVPDGFKLHDSLKHIMKNKRDRVEAGSGLDWATAEGLAFGSLLLEGNHVRITGQDVQRGTFNHRHCAVHDQATNDVHVFLNHMGLGPQETLTARNSILAEFGVLGFELGYSYEGPNALVIWEAQFGDFANMAQVMFDQFICAGEHKWSQQSALTMLLPHGYDGGGAEHSSARIERFLQLCDDDEDDVPDFEEVVSGKQIQKCNWQVANLSTPANYFHILRQQLHRNFRKPLVVASPKGLLRHKHCASSLQDMGPSSEFQRLIPERDPAIAGSPEKVKRLVFCTGKIYYELQAKREGLGLANVALVTVELIAPFPFDKIKEQLALYANVERGDGVHPGDVIWCQEEPKNMGAWSYARPRIVTVAREALGVDLVVRFVGRRAAASPATAFGKLHLAEQEAIIHEALVGHKEDGRPRPTALLGHQT